MSTRNYTNKALLTRTHSVHAVSTRRCNEDSQTVWRPQHEQCGHPAGWCSRSLCQYVGSTASDSLHLERWLLGINGKMKGDTRPSHAVLQLMCHPSLLALQHSSCHVIHACHCTGPDDIASGAATTPC